MIKSLTAREVFKRCPQVKSKLWGGEIWSDGYFASTVGGIKREITDVLRAVSHIVDLDS
jgi:REP element-mobilizing transposase RayT